MSPAEYAYDFEDLTYQLPEDALVVRGGLMQPSDLIKTAEKMWEILEAQGLPPRYGISFWAADGVSLEDLVSEVGVPHAFVRRSTAGAICAAGFEITKTGRPRHFTVWVLDVTIDTLQRLIDVFQVPEPNPAFTRIE